MLNNNRLHTPVTPIAWGGNSFKCETYPAGMETLPLDPVLVRQFARQVSIDPDMNLTLMRLLVHLATKFMSYKLYRSEFYVIKKQIPGPYGVINLRVIRPK